VITGIIQLINDAWAGVVSSKPFVKKAVFNTIPNKDNNIKKYHSLPLGKLTILVLYNEYIMNPAKRILIAVQSKGSTSSTIIDVVK
tara:strand:+ start:280 stop:537 length:258 start_codon:yes stop_codon:yes gene_type:complete